MPAISASLPPTSDPTPVLRSFASSRRVALFFCFCCRAISLLRFWDVGRDLCAIFSAPRNRHHQRRLGIVFIDIVIVRVIDIPTKELPSHPFTYWSLRAPV